MKRIFLVDDEPWVMIGLEKLIDWETLGMTVARKFTGAQAAWEEIRREKPDVVITDIRMPGISGLELLGKIREEGIPADVVLISAFADFSYAQEAISKGAFAYLLKPVKEEELLSCAEKLAGRPERKAERGEVTAEPREGNPCARGENAALTERLAEIGKHSETAPTLESLCAEMNQSTAALSQLIKKITGKTYTALIQEKRMERAREMLRDTDATMEEIAERIGYSDQFYFSKLFRKLYGESPSAYRKKARE